jgi:RimJ/RimL family protein N-acetyltransferase
MLNLRDFRADTDLINIELQPEVIGFQDAIKTPSMGRELAAAGPVFVVERDDKIVAIIGIVENKWNNSGVAWALFSHDSGPVMRGVVRYVKTWFELQTYQRLEICVEVNFEKGHKFAKFLGFEREGVKRCSTRDGKDEVMYSRIKAVQ